MTIRYCLLLFDHPLAFWTCAGPPFGRLLLENLSLEVSFGERLLVVLPASGGKSLPLDAVNINKLPGMC